MPVARKYFADFEQGEYFHVYNRTNNKELLFRNEVNRDFFLNKLHNYLDPFVELYSYSLLPNHFHLLIRVKNENYIRSFLDSKKKLITPTEAKYMKGDFELGELIERTFRRFFQCYALSFNKMFQRKGNLFYKCFKRVKVEGPLQTMNTVLYIHTNPTRHFVERNFDEYLWSSWNYIIYGDPDKAINAELFALFGGRQNFIDSHHLLANYLSKIPEEME